MTHLSASGQLDGQLRGAEHVQRLRPLRQRVAGRDSPDERPLAALAHAKVPRVQHPKAHLHQPQFFSTSCRTKESPDEGLFA